MVRPSSPHPTDLQLEILAILWRDGPSTARHIQERLPGGWDLRASSVHIALNAMKKKGYIAIEKTGSDGEAAHYRALTSKEKTGKSMLKYLVRKVFGGDTAPALQNLLSMEELDSKELDELEELIRKKKQQKSRPK
jgi:predicted transcriptional regulator